MKYIQKVITAAALTFFAAGASATAIEYEVNNLGGNTWEYIYSVENDTLAADLDNFTVYFDLGLYENLAAGATPATWDPLVIQPDPFLPDDGFYDALALVVGIAPGASLGGFAVQFDFLGAGTPGSQYFEIFDSSFNILDEGFTEAAGSAPSVPAPGSLLLIALGLLGFSAGRKACSRRS